MRRGNSHPSEIHQAPTWDRVSRYDYLIQREDLACQSRGTSIDPDPHVFGPRVVTCQGDELALQDRKKFLCYPRTLGSLRHLRMRIRFQYFFSKEPHNSSVLSSPLPGEEGEEVGVDGLHKQAAHRSQCDAEEWNVVAGTASQPA